MKLAPIVIALTLAAAATVTATACDEPKPSTTGPVMSPMPRSGQSPSPLTGDESTTATGLRLLTDTGGLIDVDSGALQRVSADGWLPAVRRKPILVKLNRHSDMSRPLQASTANEPKLPGNPSVTTIDMYAGTSLAAGIDGRIWVHEYRSKSICTLRRLGERERPTACETHLLAETPYGLWAMLGANWDRAVLIDPVTLEEKLTYPRVAVIDEHRVVSWGPDADDPVVVHDMRTKQSRRTLWPDFHGWPDPSPAVASPDGSRIAFRFGNPSNSPQIQDVWILELQDLHWVRAPGMPTFAALKSGTIAWAPDGTLVMLSVFYDKLTPEFGGQTPRKLVATWRPGNQRWELRTVPETGQFIVW